MEKLLGALAGKVQGCSEALSGQQVGNALYGMQGLSSSPAMEKLLGALAGKVEGCSEALSGQQVGNALYGLQRLEMSCSVARLMRLLAPSVEMMHADCVFVAQALYGISHFPKEKLHEALIHKVEHLEGPLTEQCKSLIAVMHLSGEQHRMPHNLVQALSLQPSQPVSSKFEREVQHIATTIIPDSQHNVYIDGFELDIYVPARKLNLEVDGPFHHLPRDRLWDERRDAYLRLKHGIMVLRIKWNDWQKIPKCGQAQSDFIKDVVGDCG